jgi:RNA polymerase sigma factor (TIGR02999 family)
LVAIRSDLTQLLQAWSRGEPEALEELAPLVHQELREVARRLLAGERRDGEWRPTELVHEGYLRLLAWRTVRWQNRAHFFSTAAGMMRRVLVDFARARQTVRRGGRADPAGIDADAIAAPSRDINFVALDDALRTLAAVNPRPSQVVELRFFGGFSVEETAEALGVSPRTVINDWNAARAWLYHALNSGTVR